QFLDVALVHDRLELLDHQGAAGRRGAGGDHVVADLAVLVVGPVAEPHRDPVEVVPQHADAVAGPAAAGQERPLAGDDVGLDQVVVDVGALRPVGVHRVGADLGGDAQNAARDGLHVPLVLGVDAVPVVAVGGVPAVAVDQAAVDLAPGRLLPPADAVAHVV